MKAYRNLITVFMACILMMPGYKANGALMTNEIRQLLDEKDRKMQELEKCDGKRKAFMIAGISTVGLTAVGIVGNVVLANKNKKLNEEITSKQTTLNNKQGTLDNLNGQIEMKLLEQANVNNTPIVSPIVIDNPAPIVIDYSGYTLACEGSTPLVFKTEDVNGAVYQKLTNECQDIGGKGLVESSKDETKGTVTFVCVDDQGQVKCKSKIDQDAEDFDNMIKREQFTFDVKDEAGNLLDNVSVNCSYEKEGRRGESTSNSLNGHVKMLKIESGATCTIYKAGFENKTMSIDELMKIGVVVLKSTGPVSGAKPTDSQPNNNWAQLKQELLNPSELYGVTKKEFCETSKDTSLFGYSLQRNAPANHLTAMSQKLMGLGVWCKKEGANWTLQDYGMAYHVECSNIPETACNEIKPLPLRSGFIETPQPEDVKLTPKPIDWTVMNQTDNTYGVTKDEFCSNVKQKSYSAYGTGDTDVVYIEETQNHASVLFALQKAAGYHHWCKELGGFWEQSNMANGKSWNCKKIPLSACPK